MNNFEKRKFLDYLEKLLPVTNTSGYSFDTVFDFMLDEFKMDKKVFMLDKDGGLDFDCYKKKDIFIRTLKKEVQKLKTKIKPQNTVLERQFLTIKEIYDLSHDEYEIMLYLTLREINNIFKEYLDCLQSQSLGTFCKEYLGIRYGRKERIMNNLHLKNITDSRFSENINCVLLKIFDNPNCNTSAKMVNTIIGKPEKSKLR